MILIHINNLGKRECIVMKKIKTLAAVAAAAFMLSSCGSSVPQEKINLVKSNFSLANDRYIKLADKIKNSDDSRLKENYAQWGGAIAQYNVAITNELSGMKEAEVDALSIGVDKLLVALEETTQKMKNSEEISVSDIVSTNENAKPENAANYDLDFTLINSTGVDIYEIYISENGQGNWKTNLIPNQKMLPAGNQIGIAFNAGESEHLWDIKAVDGDGKVVYFNGIDLSVSSEVTLSLNDNKEPVAKLK